MALQRDTKIASLIAEQWEIMENSSYFSTSSSDKSINHYIDSLSSLKDTVKEALRKKSKHSKDRKSKDEIMSLPEFSQLNYPGHYRSTENRIRSKSSLLQNHHLCTRGLGNSRLSRMAFISSMECFFQDCLGDQVEFLLLLSWSFILISSFFHFSYVLWPRNNFCPNYFCFSFLLFSVGLESFKVFDIEVICWNIHLDE